MRSKLDSRRSLITLLLANVIAIGAPGSLTSAEESALAREVYRVRLWVVTGDSPEVTEACGDSFLARLRRTIDADFGSSWDVLIEPAPAGQMAAIEHGVSMTYEQLLLVCPDLKQVDKLLVLGIEWRGTDYALQAREFDTRVRRWTFSNVAEVPLASGVLPQASHVIATAFSPVGTLGRSRDGFVEVKLHAGVYAGDESPLIPQKGALLHVVVRRRRRTEDGEAYTFSSVPWTVIRVTETELGVALCEIHSGLRNPLRVRGVSQTDRMAIQITPRFSQTLLRLHVRDNPDEPLVGYQVFAKEPGASSAYVGETAWNGTLALPRDDTAPLKIYYVKHGSLLLARLPIVAGYEQELAVGVHDDDERLRAEGVLKGIQDRLIDALARREIYAARIGRRLDIPNLDEQHIEQAKALLETSRKLPGRNEFVRELQVRQRDFRSLDATTQNRIDRLFRDTRDVILENLDPELDKLLAEQIAEAERRLQKLRDYERGKQPDGTQNGRGSFLPPENPGQDAPLTGEDSQAGESGNLRK